MLIRDTDPKPPKPVVVGLNHVEVDEMCVTVNGFGVIGIFEQDDGKVSFAVIRVGNHAGNVPFNTDAQGRAYVSGAGEHPKPPHVSGEPLRRGYSDEAYIKRADEIMSGFPFNGAKERNLVFNVVIDALKRGMSG